MSLSEFSENGILLKEMSVLLVLILVPTERFNEPYFIDWIATLTGDNLYSKKLQVWSEKLSLYLISLGVVI